MTIKGIRHLVHMITKVPEGDGDSAAPCTAGTPASTAPPSAPSEAGTRDAALDEDRTPWPAEMAAPSFMILSVRPPRDEE
ncbi:hypothetical protein [Streptomyces sp. NPDC054961]